VSHLVGRVVVGVHGTPASLQALRFAVGHARALGAALVPVIAWQPPGGDSAGRRYPTYLADEWADAAEQRLMTAFDEGLGAAPENLPTLPQVVRGPAGRVLVAVADHDDDLLVVGRSRRGRLHRAWYGSPPQYCLTHAACTVILVPPSELARELTGVRSGLRRWRRVTGGIANPPGERAGGSPTDLLRRLGVDGLDLP
jgi:nucleotide-binding universal stress UspA family protein